MSKTLGELAFNTYSGQGWWQSLSDVERSRWEAVAQAVIDDHWKQMGDDAEVVTLTSAPNAPHWLFSIDDLIASTEAMLAAAKPDSLEQLLCSLHLAQLKAYKATMAHLEEK